MKIVFFGGSGFLGSPVCDKLSDAGHDVTIVDLRPSPYLRPDQKMVTGSLLDEDLVNTVVSGADAVFDFAGLADIGESNQKPVETARINVLGNVILLASQAPLPLETISCAVRRLPLPTVVVGQARLEESAVGATLLHDADVGWPPQAQAAQS